jgi:hypothetical protein
MQPERAADQSVCHREKGVVAFAVGPRFLLPVLPVCFAVWIRLHGVRLMKVGCYFSIINKYAVWKFRRMVVT